MKLTKILSGVLTAAMVGTMLCSTAFAAEPANGEYTGEIHFLNGNGTGAASMCDSIFAHEADVTVNDDSVNLTFYVAYPIPSFSNQGTDGTIKDVVFTVDEEQYTAESDITTKPVKTFDTAGPIFGINEGVELTTQVLSINLPKTVLDQLEAGEVAASAYVNVVMNTTQNFYVQVTDLQAAGAEEDSQDMEITANVEEAVSEPTYNVTIPSSVTLGTLSAEADNKIQYSVETETKNLNGGSVMIEVPETGVLTSGKNQLAFANSFKKQTISDDGSRTMQGTILVKATDVAAAAAGNYTGTTTFSVTYTAQ